MKRDQLIVALDVESARQARKIIRQLVPLVRFYKVGLKLFSEEGPPLVREIKSKGYQVFLDLKLHDIPNTVSQSIGSLVKLEVDFLTIHASGGLEMMRAAVESARQSAKQLKKKKPKIFAVTVLTSLEDLNPLGIHDSVPRQVLRLAQLAKQAGVEGIVCSPQELSPIRKSLGNSLLLLTPGIRLEDSAQQDQRRIATPIQALTEGADYLVIGRPILEASDPQAVVKKLLKLKVPS